MKTIKFILGTRIPVYYVLAVAMMLLLIGWRLVREPYPAASGPAPSPQTHEALRTLRKQEGKLTQPLLLMNDMSQDPALEPLESSLRQFCSQKTASGEVTSVSVYFLEANSSQEFSINPTEQYTPGSVLKVATLIAYLKDAEARPELLQKQLLFRNRLKGVPEQTVTGPPMVPGRSYTIRELLEKMIIDSDNEATTLLHDQLRLESYIALFRALGYQEPKLKQWDYMLTAPECSRLLMVLFNATYLNEESSNYALQLLTRTSYLQGMSRGVDSGLTVAHKFGERNFIGEQELHETGIFYLSNRPYLLTIMTKGKDRGKLPDILAELSRLTYRFMKDRGA